MNNVILFGFKGCGKTYLGSRLAQVMAREFIDTDHLIEQATGMACRTLYQQCEHTFRTWEKRVIHSLSSKTDAVIALGGGAILDSENRQLLEKRGKLIYLEGSAELLKPRIPSDSPFFAQFDTLYPTRRALYEHIAAHKIRLDGKSTEEILEQLWAVIR